MRKRWTKSRLHINKQRKINGVQIYVVIDIILAINIGQAWQRNTQQCRIAPQIQIAR
jgi:hypothetical protein